MPLYTFKCANHHGVYVHWCSFDDIAAECPLCGVPGPRDFEGDILSQQVNTGDPFRKYHLSTRKEQAAQAQGRQIEGPRDHFERRNMEQTFGRIYVGDDTSGMSAKAQRAIEKGKRREFAYQHEAPRPGVIK